MAIKMELDAFVAGAVCRLLSVAKLRPESQMLGKTLVANHDNKQLALTYDDGPNQRTTPELLDLLARYNVRATFFLIGRFARERKSLVRRLQSAGHVLGNHTMTHPYLKNMTVSAIEREVGDCNSLLEDLLGTPVQYFRAPYGGLRPAVLRVAQRFGLQTVQWNVEGRDWEPIGAAAIQGHLEAGLTRIQGQGRGANVLLHDGSSETIDSDRSDTVRVTESLLQMAREQERQVVTINAWSRSRLA